MDTILLSECRQHTEHDHAFISYATLCPPDFMSWHMLC